MRQCVLGNAVLQVVKSIVLIGFELLGCDIVVSLNESTSCRRFNRVEYIGSLYE